MGNNLDNRVLLALDGPIQSGVRGEFEEAGSLSPNRW